MFSYQLAANIRHVNLWFNFGSFNYCFWMEEDLGRGIRVSSFEFRVSSFEFRVSSFEFRVSSFEFRVSSFEFRENKLLFLFTPVNGTATS